MRAAPRLPYLAQNVSDCAKRQRFPQVPRESAEGRVGPSARLPFKAVPYLLVASPPCCSRRIATGTPAYRGKTRAGNPCRSGSRHGIFTIAHTARVNGMVIVVFGCPVSGYQRPQSAAGHLEARKCASAACSDLSIVMIHPQFLANRGRS